MKKLKTHSIKLSSNPSFSPSIKSLKRAIEEGAKINWSALSNNQNIDLSFAKEYKNFLDWTILTTNTLDLHPRITDKIERINL